MIATQGRGHGFINESGSPARMITMYPSTAPEMTPIEDSEIVDGRPESGVMFRSEAEPYEFSPGIARYDMVGDFAGAASTYMSELIFEFGRIGAQSLPPGSRGVRCFASAADLRPSTARKTTSPSAPAIISCVRRG